MRWCPSSVLYLVRCMLLQSCTRRGRIRLPVSLRENWAYIKLLGRSLHFNSLTDSDVVFDSIFEPVFWTVDYVTRWFGLVSILCTVYCISFIYYWVFTFSSNPLVMLFSVTLYLGVCLSGCNPDKLCHSHCLCGYSANGSQNLLSSLDCLAFLLWPLEYHHDRFPLLQSYQNLSRISPYSKKMRNLFSQMCSCANRALMTKSAI